MAYDEFAYRTHRIEVNYWAALEKARRLDNLANELSRRAVMKSEIFLTKPPDSGRETRRPLLSENQI